MVCGCGGSDGTETADAGTECGNGVVDTGEECDDGAGNSDTQADACRTNCRAASCGDGVVDDGEECDDGAANSDTDADACRTVCEAPGCGDGVVDDGEECDDGDDNSDVDADACRESCEDAGCGDGVVDDGEECDDGDDIENNSCQNDCMSPALWTELDDNGGLGAVATDVAIDSAGNIAISGSLANTGDGTDILVRKYDPDGVELWTQTLADGQGNAIAIDGSDNILVAGEVSGATLLSAWVRKYDPAGNTLWTRTYEPAGGAVANGIAVGSADNVFVAGGHSDGSGIDIWVQEYDSSGTPGTPLSIDEGYSDEAIDVAVRPSGGELLIATQSTDASRNVVENSVMQYNPTGWVEIWAVSYEIAPSAATFVFGLASDASGNALVSGEVISASANDAWVTKLDGNGVEVWSETSDGPTAGIDGALAVAVDGSDNVLTAGAVDFVPTTGAALLLLQKRTAAGAEVWTWYYGAEGDSTLGLGVAADASGNVVVVGRTGQTNASPSLLVRKYGP